MNIRVTINDISLNNTKNIIIISSSKGFQLYHTSNFKLLSEFDDTKINKLVS